MSLIHFELSPEDACRFLDNEPAAQAAPDLAATVRAMLRKGVLQGYLLGGEEVRVRTAEERKPRRARAVRKRKSKRKAYRPPCRPADGSFVRWLKQQGQRQDPVGALAREAAFDYFWPARKAGLRGWRTYMLSRGASDEVLAALDRAWAEFTQQFLGQEAGDNHKETGTGGSAL